MSVEEINQSRRGQSTSQKAGQSTVEYIILVGIVVGAVMLFMGPVGNIIASAIKTQKDTAETKYTYGERDAYKKYYDKAGVVIK